MSLWEGGYCVLTMQNGKGNAVPGRDSDSAHDTWCII